MSLLHQIIMGGIAMNCPYCNLTNCPLLNKEQCPIRKLVERVEVGTERLNEVNNRLQVTVDQLSMN